MKPKTQDGRPLRRYKRRWKVERLFAWLQNYRRLINRFDYGLGGIPANFLLDSDGKIVARDLHGRSLDKTLKKLMKNYVPSGDQR